METFVAPMLNQFANIFGMESWMIILALALLLFGGAKLPQLARGAGRSIREFQEGLKETKDSIQAGMKTKEEEHEPEHEKEKV